MNEQPEWITLEQLEARWNMTFLELQKYIFQAGLIPYDSEYRKIPYLDKRPYFFLPFRSLYRPRPLSPALSAIENKKHEDLAAFMTEIGLNKVRYFTVANIVEVEQECEIALGQSHQNEPQPPKNGFIREGDIWKIYFKGQAPLSVKHLIGLTYIANVIMRKSIHVSDLYELADGRAKKDSSELAGSDVVKKELADGSLSISDMSMERHDAKAIKDYRRRIGLLAQAMKDTELPQREREDAEIEHDRILAILYETFLERNNTTKKDADNVGKAVKRALDALRKQGAKNLTTYLSTYVIGEKSHYRFTDTSYDWTIIP